MKGFKNFSAPAHAIAPTSSTLIPLGITYQARALTRKCNPAHGMAPTVLTRLLESFSSWS